jgi:hypothetical protein
MSFLAKHPPQLTDLKCEGRTDNNSVAVARPLFSWRFEDQDWRSRQDSVHLKVGLVAGDASLWDYRAAGSLPEVRYQGKILAPNKIYRWCVKVTDEDGLHSQFVHGTFHIAWESPPIEVKDNIEGRHQMDEYVLRQYLEPLKSLAGIYQNANEGKKCVFRLDFEKLHSPGGYALKINFESSAPAIPITFSDRTEELNAESALWSMLESAHENLQIQLNDYNKHMVTLQETHR